MIIESFQKKINPIERIGHIIFFLLLAYASYRTIFFLSKMEYWTGAEPTASVEHYFYMFNLLLHELSHPLFHLFGEFMGVLGGTIGEFIFPIAFLVYFNIHESLSGIIFSIWWIGFNIVTTGPYMQDAIVQQIPLLVEGSTHDWWYMFRRLGVLPFSQTIGSVVMYIGWIVLISVLCVYFFFIVYSFRSIKNSRYTL